MKPLLAALATITLAAPFALAIDGNGLNDRALDPLIPKAKEAPAAPAPTAEDERSHCDQAALERLKNFDGHTGDGIEKYLHPIDLPNGRRELRIRRLFDKDIKKSEGLCDFAVWEQVYYKGWYTKDLKAQAKWLDAIDRALMAAERRQEAAAKAAQRVGSEMSLESSGQTPVQTKLPTIFTED